MNSLGRAAAAALRRAGALGLLACLTGCEAMVPYHWDSAESEGERTALVLETVAAAEAPALDVNVPRSGVRAEVRTDPRIFESRLSKLIARSVATATRPPYSWGASAATDFYADTPRQLGNPASPAASVQLEVRPAVRGFKLERWLKGEHATTIEFSVEPAQDAFRVTLERITVDYSRAKVADNSWVNFWTRIPLLYGFASDIARIFGLEYGDDAVDMQIDVGFNSSWTDARGETHFAPIAVLGWTVLDVELGAGAIEVGTSSGWLPLPPLSVRQGPDGGLAFGRGHLALWSLVTEQDELSHDFVSERSSIGEYMDELLGLLPVPVPTP